MFDNQVYGVAYGLLMGCRKEVWVQAQSLFDEVRRMDSSTASAFYNALTDMLWHFGQVKNSYMTLPVVIFTHLAVVYCKFYKFWAVF